MRRLVPLVALALAFPLAAPALLAQAHPVRAGSARPARPAPPTPEDYRLTSDRITAWMRASRDAEQLLQRDTALAERVRERMAPAEDEEDDDDIDLDAVVQRLAAEPALARVVTAAGLSLEDFVLTEYAIQVASVQLYADSVSGEEDEAELTPAERANQRVVHARLPEIALVLRDTRRVGWER